MNVEQRAFLKLAEENAANAVAFLQKHFPKLAREQLKAALQNLELAEMLGGPLTPAQPPQIIDIEASATETHG